MKLKVRDGPSMVSLPLRRGLASMRSTEKLCTTEHEDIVGEDSMGDIREIEKKTEMQRAKNELLGQQAEEAKEKAAIAEAKRMYGKDWKKMLGGAFSHMKVNKDAMQSLHSMGMGGQELRNMSNPAFLKRK
jgi:hypothetical protein